MFITGDFNRNTLKATLIKKNCNICQYFNLDQLIVEPTHFTENTSSIIDLVFTSNKSNILSSGVGDPFLEQNVQYHCPVYFLLNFHKIIAPASQRHIWLYERRDYQSFSRDIHETNWEPLKHNDIDIYAKKVTDQISELDKIIFQIKQSRYDSLIPLGKQAK